MKSLRALLVVLLLAAFFSTANGQCAHDPRITGDTLLCPNASGILLTQTYDSYQWYKREYGTGVTNAIVGASAQTLPIGPADVLYYFSVDATQAGCTERSPEVLLDSRTFLLPYVISTGDFTTGGNGEAVICTGDTMYLTLGTPYDTLITWWRNGNVIPGADSTVLIVTTAGIYTCEGAPRICPDFLLPLGVDITVLEINCGVGRADATSDAFTIFPNPASDWLSVRSNQGDLNTLRLYNSLGQLVLLRDVGAPETRLDLSALPKGYYWIATEMGNRGFVLR